MPQLRSDQTLIHVTITGSFLDKSAWASMDGGDMTATDTKTRPGGMGDEKNLGGPRSRTDCIVERQYTNDLIHPIIANLESLCGTGAGKISWTTLDGDGNPNGPTESITGVLKEVKKPKWDANASGTAFLTLTFGCDATPTVLS